MAEAILTEEQRALLERLRKKLGYTNDLDHKEEDLRLYQMLGAYSQEEKDGRKDKFQNSGDMHALLRELKEYIIRNGTEGALYMDAMDLLQALAPEQVADAKNMLEENEEQKAQELEEQAKVAQERAQAQAQQLGFQAPSDDDGNGIPDEVDEYLRKKEEEKKKEKEGEEATDEKEAVKDLAATAAESIRDLTDAQARRKMGAEEVSEMLNGSAKPKHKRAEQTEAQKSAGLQKEDDLLNRNIAITPKKR